MAAVRKIGALVLLLGLWEVASRAGWADPYYYASPLKVASVLVQQFASGKIWIHIWYTLYESILGLLLGFLAGAVLGWLAAKSGPLSELIEPFMMLLNSIPRIVVAPMFAMWFGLGIASKVALSFFLVFVIMFFAVYSALREVDRALVERVRMLGGSTADLLREVYIPSVLAWVFSSLRVMVGFAFTGAVVGEIIASSKGLGYLLNFAMNTQNAAQMLGMVVLIVVIVLLLFAVMQRVEHWATAWKRADERGAARAAGQD